MANSLDPDKTACYEPYHLDQHCLQSYLSWSLGMKELSHIFLDFASTGCLPGPNCSYRGHVIPEGKFIIGPSGEEIHCVTGSYDGGSVEIRHRTTTSARSN